MRTSLALASLLLVLTPAFAAVGSKQNEAVRLNNIGAAMMNQQRMDAAVKAFDQALAADSSLTVAEMNKGIALLNLQKVDEAEVLLERAAKKRPTDPRAWCNLGLAHRASGQYERAIADFRRVLSIDSSDADTYYLLGTSYAQLQDYKGAISAFEAALKINATHASAEFGLARALQRSGDNAGARQHLNNFERLTREKISSAMTVAYGEQGKYSTAEEIRTDEKRVSPMIPIRFIAPTSVTQSAPGAPEGGPACIIDLEGKGREAVLVMGGDSLHAYTPLANGLTAVDVQAFGIAAKGRPLACAVGDYDNDGHSDLAIQYEDRLALYKGDGKGHFTENAKAAGLNSSTKASSLTFVDYDHDGDLDLVVSGRAEKAESKANLTVWRNNGNGTFTNWTKEGGFEFDQPVSMTVLSDVNNDRAVDLIVAPESGSPSILLNRREGPFERTLLYDVQLPPVVGISVLDFDKDGWMDIALTHSGSPGVTLWKNVEGKRFERVSLPLKADRAWGITPVDFDNDGWIDLAVVAQIGSGRELRLLRNVGVDGFADVSAAVGLQGAKLPEAATVMAFDADQDGDSDLVVSSASGTAVVLHNDGGNKNHSLRIKLTGLADNKSAFGTKVEVFAEDLWQKFEVSSLSGYRSQGASELLVGLGAHTSADIVRMLWPTGVLQDETEVAANKPLAITEMDRRGSSCPTLFAWNGEKYEFISDVIGAAVVGHWISPTEKNVADPGEWVKIDGNRLAPKDGRFSLRFGEPMEEVNYVDQVRLVAIDHPADTQVYPDERFLSNPPFPDGHPIAVSGARPVSGAWDDKGNDVLAPLSESDHRYVRDFKNMAYAGFANMHSLTLDLGNWSSQRPLRLLLQGFIEYFSASSMYSAWQAGINPIAPYMEAQLADGSWKRVIDDMGFPAGLPRTIVVDLSGKLPTGTRKVRISTNLQIYWDQILLANGTERMDFRQTELTLTGADLQFRGYPKQIDGETPGDLTYDYQQASYTGPFSRERGIYTRYGNVSPLLHAIDDHYVIFGSGEDIDLQFEANPLPELPDGWKRDYFFYANGFVKDMDFYEGSPFTVAQLPFHKMSTYPYPSNEHYPDDDVSVEYMLEWNTRFDTGAPNAPAYRFEYEPRRP